MVLMTAAPVTALLTDSGSVASNILHICAISLPSCQDDLQSAATCGHRSRQPISIYPLLVLTPLCFEHGISGTRSGVRGFDLQEKKLGGQLGVAYFGFEVADVHERLTYNNYGFFCTTMFSVMTVKDGCFSS